jgi:hypothetical protein
MQIFESYVMREICVHDDHKVSSDEVQAMDICSSVFTIELWRTQVRRCNTP